MLLRIWEFRHFGCWSSHPAFRLMPQFSNAVDNYFLPDRFLQMNGTMNHSYYYHTRNASFKVRFRPYCLGLFCIIPTLTSIKTLHNTETRAHHCKLQHTTAFKPQPQDNLISNLCSSVLSFTCYYNSSVDTTPGQSSIAISHTQVLPPPGIPACCTTLSSTVVCSQVDLWCSVAKLEGRV